MTQAAFKYAIGDELKDHISGFVGIVTGLAEYHSLCRRYILEGVKLSRDGRPASITIDEEQAILKTKAKRLPLKNGKPDPSSAKRQFRFGLGDGATDEITGFAGTIYARFHWYNGCDRYTIVSGGKKKGKPIEATFNENTIKVTAAGKFKPDANATPPGGPYDDPPRTSI